MEQIKEKIEIEGVSFNNPCHIGMFKGGTRILLSSKTFCGIPICELIKYHETGKCLNPDGCKDCKKCLKAAGGRKIYG